MCSVFIFYCDALVFHMYLGCYIGLQGASVYDVVGLKNIAQGYMITSCAYGLTTLITISAAGMKSIFLSLI